MLRQVEEPVAKLATQFTAHFYDALSSAAQTAKVLGRLSPTELSSLQLRQAQHLIMLLAPDLTAPSHHVEAEHAGKAHALVGVDILWLIEAYSLYQHELHQLISPLVQEAHNVLSRSTSAWGLKPRGAPWRLICWIRYRLGW